MSCDSTSTYIYRHRRIDPQAEPFPIESASIVQSNGLSESSGVCELGDCEEKNPSQINLFHTFSHLKYFPKNETQFSKLFPKITYNFLRPKFFVKFSVFGSSPNTESMFHDVPRSFGLTPQMIFVSKSLVPTIKPISFLSRLRVLAQLCSRKNLPVSPASPAKPHPDITKVST